MKILKPLARYSSFRRIALAQWGPPSDPVIHGHMWLDVTRAEEFIQEQRAKHGAKVSLGTLVGKAAALALASMPEANAKVIGRKIYQKTTVDVFFQVDVGRGADLAGAVIPEADKVPLHEIADRLTQKALRIRGGQDIQYEKTQKGGLFKWAPIPMLAWVLRTLSFLLYWLGVPSRFLGATEPDPFGSCMVTNVASFGIDVAYAPLVPWTRVPFIFLVGKAQERPTVIDGELTVRRMLPVSATIDHRVVDGAHIGQLAQIMRRFVEHPNEEGRVELS